METKWPQYIHDFKTFLSLEKSLSPNSVSAYLHDINKFFEFLKMQDPVPEPETIDREIIRAFIFRINELGVSPRSQARIISGVKSFFRYLLLEYIIETDPAALIEGPRIGRKLPDVLSVHEIDRLISLVDLSKPEGRRNKAIVETLYSCGLRVSELTGLKISDLYFKLGYIKVIGKGDKERLVPVSSTAVKEIQQYLEERRKLKKIEKSDEDILFLSRNGRRLSRVMIFHIIKDLAERAGLRKSISPHTFRHSFATHMIDGGADLRAVQEMLGHESITTTEIYTHLDQAYLRDNIIQFHPRS